jgi:hypothetical protein
MQIKQRRTPIMSQRKQITLKISLELLCQIWDNRENPNDDLDTAIEKLLTKGLNHEGIKP